MPSFSSLDAASEGFRITRERPLAVLTWAFVLFAVALGSTAILELMAGDAMRSLTAMESGPEPTAEELGQVLGSVAPAFLVVILVSLPVSAIIANAIMRAATAGRGDALGYLRLGPRDAWQTLNLFLWSLILLVVYVVAAIVGTIPALVLSFLGALIAGPVAMAVAPFVTLALVALVVLLVSARLILAGPITTMEGGVGLGRSWTATKGATWPLTGALFIGLVFSLTVATLVGVVALAVMAAIGGGVSQAWAYIQSGAGEDGPFSMLALTYTAFSSIVNTLLTVIMFGVGVGAYRQLRSPRSAAAAADPAI